MSFQRQADSPKEEIGRHQTYRHVGYSPPVSRQMRQQCSCRLVRRFCFTPSQLGVGVSGGCEAAIPATRRFLSNMPDNFVVVVKIDFSNAFNCIRRDSVLAAVSVSILEIIVYVAYSL